MPPLAFGDETWSDTQSGRHDGRYRETLPRQHEADRLPRPSKARQVRSGVMVISHTSPAKTFTQHRRGVYPQFSLS